KDENELQHMLASAIKYPGPAALRFPRGSGLGVPLDPKIKAIPIGESELLRDGDDLAILAIGTMVHPALEAAQELGNLGCSAAVVNARFAKPLDEVRLLSLARRCRALVTVEEHVGSGGFGSAVLELLAREGITVPTHCVAIEANLVEHGETRASQGLDVSDIVAACRELVSRASGAPEPD
ncbi:MAG: transketolase C-terminal domain-containing protein, partial [Myxococcota bacterium]